MSSRQVDQKFCLNDTVELRDGRKGVIKFIGETQFETGIWFGIYLPRGDGRNNGTVNGHKYFSARRNGGIFIRRDKIRRILQSSNHSNSRRITINDRVEVIGKGAGVVRFLGTTHFQKGDWCGVELDTKVGTNNGTLESVKYFTCEPHHGIFVRDYKMRLIKHEGREPSRSTIKSSHSQSTHEVEQKTNDAMSSGSDSSENDSDIEAHRRRLESMMANHVTSNEPERPRRIVEEIDMSDVHRMSPGDMFQEIYRLRLFIHRNMPGHNPTMFHLSSSQNFVSFDEKEMLDVDFDNEIVDISYLDSGDEDDEPSLSLSIELFSTAVRELSPSAYHRDSDEKMESPTRLTYADKPPLVPTASRAGEPNNVTEAMDQYLRQCSLVRQATLSDKENALVVAAVTSSGSYRVVRASREAGHSRVEQFIDYWHPRNAPFLPQMNPVFRRETRHGPPFVIENYEYIGQPPECGLDPGESDECNEEFKQDLQHLCELAVKDQNPTYLTKVVHSLFLASKALGELHANGWFHLDFSLENVVAEGSRVVLVDFEASVHSDSQWIRQRDACIMQKLRYVSPEASRMGQLLDSNAFVDGALVDVWAFGVSLFLAICGAFPFDNPKQCFDDMGNEDFMEYLEEERDERLVRRIKSFPHLGDLFNNIFVIYVPIDRDDAFYFASSHSTNQRRRLTAKEVYNHRFFNIVKHLGT